MLQNIENALNRKISETIEHLTYLKTKYAVDTPEYEMYVGSVQRRLDQLTSDKEELDTGKHQKITAVIKTEDYESGQVSVRILNSVLSGFQDMADSIATHKAIGVNSGRMREDILNQTELIVVSTGPGSFVINLEPKKADPTLLDNPLISETISTLFNLLEKSGNEEEIIEPLVTIGKRAVTKYASWLDDLSKLNIELELSQKSVYHGKSKIKIDANFISKRREVLRKYEQNLEEDTELNVKLVGVNSHKMTIDILEWYDEKESIISMYVSGEIIEMIKNKTLLDKEVMVTADIETVTNSTSKKTKKSYVFKSMRERY